MILIAWSTIGLSCVLGDYYIYIIYVSFDATYVFERKNVEK